MSYGTNTPFGLRPVRTLLGAPFTEGFGLTCSIASGYAANLIPGDPVTFSGTASSSGKPGIIRGVAGSGIVGVFGGIIQIDTVPTTIYGQMPSWVSGTVTTGETLCVVYTDPNIIYEIQTNVDGAVVAVDIGLNANFIFDEGSLATNQSGVAIDWSTRDTTATLNLKLVGLGSNPNNAFGTVYNVAEVLINNHVFRGGTGTLGL